MQAMTSFMVMRVLIIFGAVKVMINFMVERERTFLEDFLAMIQWLGVPEMMTRSAMI